MTNNGHAGESEPIRLAFDRYEGQLTRYAQRITGNVEHARDVVQETFFRLCRQDIEQVDGHLTEWLFTVCRNKALDIRRKEARMTSMADATLADTPTNEPEPNQQIERAEQNKQVVEMLERLPPNQREVIALKFQNGLSYKEISRVTGLSISNVGFLLHRGLKTIRETMKKPEQEE